MVEIYWGFFQSRIYEFGRLFGIGADAIKNSIWLFFRNEKCDDENGCDGFGIIILLRFFFGYEWSRKWFGMKI